ncbi:RhoGAP-domain-containing protein [Linderina pennispora]|uniref:RhoGAP-domain-containing protein n=1 Tax=Linderina pennispora TaxID=61395 RepID=A0A1Y1W6M5_9FUNG|nr:RhoGAP-domain-containing protein [Linderina pennispora]ORX69200.1 RhoGAP-domain-containing protein [Linderina pennispora]
MIAGVPVGCVSETGEPCIVPTVVAICGQHLRENGQQTQGIFRVNGSMKRVQKLQDEFNTPPEYGRRVGWDGYTLHDAATLLRRYLNSLPEPVISTDFYDDFRNLLIENIPHNDKLHMYASLISQLPAESRHTLLYVLELLALFAKPENAKLTLMTSSNLAAVLQPCLLVHPGHVADPQEYVRSKAVIEFLIVNAAKIRGPESELSAAGGQRVRHLRVLSSSTPTTHRALT